ncbi:MAG TPA: PAS domain S-box protein [Pyrinomonadaceae bacterium]|jgi:PAS domain S-box-containing protein
MSLDPPKTPAHEELTPEEWAERLRGPELSPYWLSAVIDSAGDAIITKTLDGRITSWNRGAERIFGYTADEVVGKPVTILIPEDRPDEEPGILSRLVRGERIEHYETVRVRKDGSRVDISLTVSPVRGPGGEVIGVSKIARDITDRKQAEEALRRSERELGDFFENAVVGLHWVGPDGTILRANRAELEMLGYEADEYVGRHISEFHADADAIGDILARLQADEVLHEYPARLRCKDGSIRHVLIDSSVKWDDGRFGHTRCFTRDITERLRAEQERERLLESERRARHEAEEARREAEDASRVKDEFLATLSHELRTPLTAILGWAYMLRTGQLGGADAAAVYQTIERNARTQAQLVDDLLDVSRIITGKLRLDLSTVDPASFVDSAVESVRPAAEGKGVRLRSEVRAGAARVAGDPVRLQQVVWNLLSNAIKFTPQGGSVEVRLARAGGQVEISVSDTGDGIAPDFLPHVFDRFRQADGRITRQHGGLGLGLSIVRHLVELHGGTARAESEGEGRGATFTVMLPSASADAAGSEHASTPEPPPPDGCPERLDGLRVLIVDDEPDTLLMLKIGLSRCGAEVETAGAAAEALAALDAGRFDVIISDIGMPLEDGYDLIRKVRARPAEAGGRTPAVALTAYARVEDRLQALRAGYQMHVPKPVELMELVAVTHSLVRRTD